MSLPLERQHLRFVQQAAWTAELRRYVFEQAGLKSASRVLEVGCGTAAVLGALPARAAAQGLDIDLPSLRYAARLHPKIPLVAGDAHDLPYPDNSFDLVYCHFLLLWLRAPQRALAEMRRVTRPGGIIAAFAEPDYSARIDKPEELESLGAWQRQALQQQGAEPALGGKLAQLFHRAGLKEIESGPLKIQPTSYTSRADLELEHEVLRADLQGLVEADELDHLLELDRRAWEAGERVLFVPTHYAWGKA